MELSDPSIKKGSTVLQLFEYIQKKAPQWIANSQAVGLIQQNDKIDDDNPLREDISAVETNLATEPHSDSDEVSSPSAELSGEEDGTNPTPTETDHTATPTPAPPGLKSSGIYRGWTAVQHYITSAWFYRWLTAEPDADVIVIDLRETISAGPLLAQLDEAIRDAVGVMPTSIALRGGFRLRTRFRDRPLRIISMGVIGCVILGFLGVATTGEAVGLPTVVLFVLLLLAIRGTQTTRSWDSLVESPWGERLLELVSVPEPPDTDRSPAGDDTPAEIIQNKD